MTKPVSIAVIGSINLDIVANAATLPRAGETVTGATLAYHPGGKGANQALAARRLGADVTMVGSVGADAAADQALALLRADGVDLSRVFVDKNAATGVALIAVSASGENQIVVASGANEALKPELLMDFPWDDFDAIICQLETPIATIETVAREAKCFFAINLAPAQTVPSSILERADLIIVNEIEAGFYGDALLGLKGVIVTTLGATGAQMRLANGPTVSALPPKVTPVDTTGAGDTFVGALVLAIMEGHIDPNPLAFACAAGAVSTLKAGAQPSMPWRADVDGVLV